MSARAHDMITRIAKAKKATPAIVIEALELIATGEATPTQASALAMGLRMADWEGDTIPGTSAEEK